MLVTLRLPKLGPYMDNGVIDKLYIAGNEPVFENQKILDLRVDLNLTFAHDCPPVNYYRIVAGEKAYLRRLNAVEGDALNVGDTIALFSSEIDGALDRAEERQLIVSVIGIIPEEIW